MSKLLQMRRGIDKLINIDRDIGTVVRTATVDNGRGAMIPDGKPKEHMIVCRISNQSVSIWQSKQWEGGLTIEKTPFVLARFDADIQQGDSLEWRGRNYTIGVVTRPEIDGGFICTQAPLTKVA